MTAVDRPAKGQFNRVHAICRYLKYGGHGWPDSGRCKLCPAWTKDPKHGKVQKGCYGQAQEVLNIAQHGNPWGKKGVPKHIKNWRKRFNDHG